MSLMRLDISLDVETSFRCVAGLAGNILSGNARNASPRCVVATIGRVGGGVNSPWIIYFREENRWTER